MAEKVNSQILKTINTYLDVLRANHTQFESAWLFGSFARDCATEDSDIDIAFVMPQVVSKFDKELELTRCRRHIDSRIEPHVFNAGDLDGPFYQEVLKQGVRVA